MDAEVNLMQQDLFSDENVLRASQTINQETSADHTDDVVGISALRPAPSAVIEDAGEELIYNRRNRDRRAKTWSDISGLNDALKAKEATKANVWPKPDYEELVSNGMLAPIAHIVKQVYDAVSVKPSRNVLDDEVIQKYIAGVNRIEKGLMDWVNDSQAIQQWIQSKARVAGVISGAMSGQRIALSDLNEDNKSLLDVVYPQGWKAYSDEMRLCGGNKLLSALQPGHGELDRAFKAIKKGWPAKLEAWQVQGLTVQPASAGYEAMTNPPRFVVFINDRFVTALETLEAAQEAVAGVKAFGLFSKGRYIASFDAEEEAIDAAKARSQRGKKNVIGEKGTRVDQAERVGVLRRLEGEDISAERLVTEFGFKGVNFGNWMKTPAARAEAQLHLNHVYDAFHDLADIIGVPPKAMSLGGMLGVAIGAQGSGGAHAAHFVPGVNEINITRTQGAGSLAHEWGHALDHSFAMQAGMASVLDPMLTHWISERTTKTVYEMVDGRQVGRQVPRFDGVIRPEIVSAFKTIVDAMDYRLQTQEEADKSANQFVTQNKERLGREINRFSRQFQDQPEAFEKLVSRINAGDFGDGMVAVSKSTYLSPVVVELRLLYKEKHGRLLSLDDVKSLQFWIDRAKYREEKGEVAATPQKSPTVYSSNANKLDKDKGGKPYWGTRCEKFARAFDAYVSDALVEKEARNDYLSHTGREGETVPSGEERQNINAAFRTLVSEIKVRDPEHCPVLFSIGAGVNQVAMPIADIHAEIKRLRTTWKNMPPVTVVRSAGELPFEAPEHGDGAYHAGRVYVIADNMFDMKQLQKVMAHECIMHHSIEEMLGDYGFSKLHHGIQYLKAKGDPTIKALADDIQKRYGPTMPDGVLPSDVETKEIIARAGELALDSSGNVKIEFGFMKSVYAGVAGWLRDLGFSIPFTNVELQGVMHAAGQWILTEPEPAISLPHFAGKMALNSLADPKAASAGQSNDEAVSQVVADGTYNGKILSIKQGVVTQKIGREGQTIDHAQQRLSNDVKIGDIVEIKYVEGKGNVKGPSHQLGQQR